MKFYTLEGHNVVPCHSQREWLKWFSRTPPEERTVARHRHKDGHTVVSTVFIGVDNRMGTPHIFETCIIGGPCDGYKRFSATWAQAEQMHARAVGIAQERTRSHFLG